MRKIVSIVIIALVSLSAIAQEKKDIVKTGYNFGPLPAIAYDADKGLQLGAILNVFNYGDGSSYPNYNSKMYFEASFFTKGSMLFQCRYDNKTLIPGVRWCTIARANIDKAYDFYGFNGYGTNYNLARVKDKSSYLFSPFYRMKKNEFQFRSDLIGDITGNLKWEAGIVANYFSLSTIDYANINKGKADDKKYPEGQETLFDIYKKSGIISAEEAEGGFCGGLRAGLVYDSRDKEGAPTRGIWAEGHLIGSFLGKTPFWRYSLTFRHYVPIVKNDILTFAYRLNYEGNFGNKAPFYALPYMTVMGEKQDLEGMGGYNTIRGIVRTRVVGLDMASFNAEFRWRFVKFHLWKQNIALGLNAFSDGTMATRGIDISALPETVTLQDGSNISINTKRTDTPHITVGAGFRFIMNENFIVAADYGMPVTHFMKNSPLYNQDGSGAFYVNLGYLF